MGMSAVRLAVILGTNEIASAVAVYLHREGYCVVLSHDPNPPVIRRKMAFHDALYADFARLENVIGERVDDTMHVFAALSAPRHVLVTWLGLLDLLPVHEIDVLIDARMQTNEITPDLRGLAHLSIGLGAGFSTASNCDIAIETIPERIVRIIHDGATSLCSGRPADLGGMGLERFVYSAHEGRWHSSVEIGTRVYKGFVIGHLGAEPICAPCDGHLRGIVRDGSDVPGGIKLLEIDPRTDDDAQWTGIDERGHAIAHAALAAIERRLTTRIAAPPSAVGAAAPAAIS